MIIEFFVGYLFLKAIKAVPSWPVIKKREFLQLSISFIFIKIKQFYSDCVSIKKEILGMYFEL